MKKRLKFFAVIFLLIAGFQSTAQNKFGHIDFAELYRLMPGHDSIKQVYETYARGLQNQLALMQAELESKFTDYQANQATWSNIIRQTKERELTDIQLRLEDFKEQAQIDLRRKEEELTAPLIEKARKAVEDVAKEHGYTYIFNSSELILIYANPSDDIMPLVKRKLGIKK